MFLAIASAVSVPPVIASGGIFQDGNSTAIDCIIYGKQGLLQTVALEREDSVGSGTYSQLATASVIVTNGISISYTAGNYLVFNTIVPGSIGYKYRLRVLSPAVGNYSNIVTNTITYIANPGSSIITASINGPRTQVTWTVSGAYTFTQPSGSLWTSGNTVFIESETFYVSASNGPFVHTMLSTPAPADTTARWENYLDYAYGHWYITKYQTV